MWWNWGHLLSRLFTIYMFDFNANISYLYHFKPFIINPTNVSLIEI